MEWMTLAGGVRMPMLGFGTWQLRGAQGRRCVREALEVGYRLLDTARMYENEDTSSGRPCGTAGCAGTRCS